MIEFSKIIQYNYIIDKISKKSRGDYMITHLFGLGAMISLFLIYQQKDRRKIIIHKLSADLFWIAHYFCLGATAGMIPNFVGVFRELVFINRKTKRWASFPLWVFVFISINFALGIKSFKMWYDIVPIIASSFVTVSLWIDNPNLTKIISLPVSAAFLVYDIFVGSYMGILNESIAICSIIIYFIKKTGGKKMFSKDIKTEKELKITEGKPIENVAKLITTDISVEAEEKGKAFAKEITDNYVADFEKPGDMMAHVSTFIVHDNTVFVTYYANTQEASENPAFHTARLAWAPVDDINNINFMDIQTVGDTVEGKKIDNVYDTILMKKDENTLYVMWTASTEDNYYRFYCPFYVSEKKLGKIGVNRFKVKDTVNDFSVSGIKTALAANDIPCKKMYSDIGIMQKLSSRVEGGETYYYSGTYSGDFNCVIKSKDLITWEYVSQPDFINDSKWENAVYVLKDKVYYFVRQQDTNKSGFLTAYDLNTEKWDTPVEIYDCQSRSDFIVYDEKLYLFHAPTDREHIGIVEIDIENIANSKVVLQAKMDTSCFYPFIQYYENSELAMSYTVERKHIRLAKFNMKNYI